VLELLAAVCLVAAALLAFGPPAGLFAAGVCLTLLALALERSGR
jgi:hypothetical protein